MKNIKRAFTLAETLLTLGIVGIVAMMLIPGLQNVINTDVSSAALLKTTKQIENGMQNLLSHAKNKSNATVLSGLYVKDVLGASHSNASSYITSNDYLFSLTKGLVGAGSVSNDNYISSITKYSSNDSVFSSSDKISLFDFDGNSGYVIYKETSDDDINTYTNGRTYIPENIVIARLYIDANRTKLPNKLGQDIYLFGLTDGGKLVPAGSAEYNNNVFKETVPLYTEENGCGDLGVGDGSSCAAKVVHEGWKIDL